ncbi:MAG: M50 family metallopeptidase [Coriobacteriales bacterium]|jgi:regulator of sigma E protease|nr:M50 family metallopeptidase [Coriobacteriales bacterium]
MFDVILTIFWGLVLLSIIVFVHELGHFLTARAFKLRVKEFMIGLPGPNIGFKRKDTKYGITALPLGGYCLIAGMEGGEDNPDLSRALALIAYFGTIDEEQAARLSDQAGFDIVKALDTLSDWGTAVRSRKDGQYRYEIAAATLGDNDYAQGAARPLDDPDAFIQSEHSHTYGSLPWWRRMCILFAGSFFNLLFAVAVFCVILMAQGQQVTTTTVQDVVADSPAAAAHIETGDVLVSIDGQELTKWEDLTAVVATHAIGDSITVGVNRDGTYMDLPIKLIDNGNGKPIIGITSQVVNQSLSFGDALSTSVGLIGVVFNAIVQLINPATFADTVNQTSSVVGISMEAKAAAGAGPLSFILLAAALSISIGLMNLLPIPPFDGGKIVIATIERIARRKIPVSVVNGISIAGIVAVIMLVFIATNADIHRYFLNG